MNDPASIRETWKEFVLARNMEDAIRTMCRFYDYTIHWDPYQRDARDWAKAARILVSIVDGGKA